MWALVVDTGPWQMCVFCVTDTASEAAGTFGGRSGSSRRRRLVSLAVEIRRGDHRNQPGMKKRLGGAVLLYILCNSLVACDSDPSQGGDVRPDLGKGDDVETEGEGAQGVEAKCYLEPHLEACLADTRDGRQTVEQCLDDIGESSTVELHQEVCGAFLEGSVPEDDFLVTLCNTDAFSERDGTAELVDRCRSAFALVDDEAALDEPTPAKCYLAAELEWCVSDDEGDNSISACLEDFDESFTVELMQEVCSAFLGADLPEDGFLVTLCNTDAFSERDGTNELIARCRDAVPAHD